MRKALAAPIAAGVLGLAALAIPVAAQASSGPDTTTTFGVTEGPLTITTPDTASLGAMTVGTDTHVSASLGTVTVTDDRAPLAGSWAASVSSTDFTTGAGTPAETIPAADVAYAPGAAAHVGIVTPAAGSGGALNGDPATAFSASAEDGISSVSWAPTITVTPPSSAVAGSYSGTITHSVA